MFNTTNCHLYHYAGNNPVRYVDPDGNAAETIWDIYSLVTGAKSLVEDIREGNVKAAVIDGLGVIADVAAVAIPFVPGGAGVAIKALKVAGSAATIAGGILSVEDALENGDYIAAGLQVLQVISGAGQLSSRLSVGKKVSPIANSVNSPCHGNSKLSTKTQHGYEIYNIKTGDVVKTGISGQPLNKNGTSPRANRQVNKFNKELGENIYGARVVEKNIPDRATALDWEKKNTNRLYREGHPMNKHIYPRPEE